MLRRLNHLWRLIGTGWAFIFIFFGGGVLAATILPILALLPGHTRGRAQFCIHMAFRFCIEVLCSLRIIALKVEDTKTFEHMGGKMLIANHPSLLDVVILMSLVPKTQCIVKNALWNHRFLGPLMRAAGYIPNDLDPQELVEHCRQSLKDDYCLIIFPEGTRTLPGQPVRFQRGFANLALFAKVIITPVFITCDPPSLQKGDPWWKLPPQKSLFGLSVGKDIDVESYFLYGPRGVAARHMVETLENYYRQKMAHG